MIYQFITDEPGDHVIQVDADTKAEALRIARDCLKYRLDRQRGIPALALVTTE